VAGDAVLHELADRPLLPVKDVEQAAAIEHGERCAQVADLVVDLRQAPPRIDPRRLAAVDLEPEEELADEVRRVQRVVVGVGFPVDPAVDPAQVRVILATVRVVARQHPQPPLQVRGRPQERILENAQHSHILPHAAVLRHDS
jgi:hypothetical protein